MDIGLILSMRYRGAEWVMNGSDYESLVWLSDAGKPTEGELQALWPSVQNDVDYAQVESARALAYRETSDPIFFQYQRGDKTEAEWLSAVEAVKAAHPYPEA
jgi:hypothetical protein